VDSWVTAYPESVRRHLLRLVLVDPLNLRSHAVRKGRPCSILSYGPTLPSLTLQPLYLPFLPPSIKGLWQVEQNCSRP
jgi:hypothetical protein